MMVAEAAPGLPIPSIVSFSTGAHFHSLPTRTSFLVCTELRCREIEDSLLSQATGNAIIEW